MRGGSAGAAAYRGALQHTAGPMTSPAPAPVLATRWLALAALALAVLHLMVLHATFPVQLFVDDVPLASADYHYLLSTTFEGRAVLRDGHLWGYSPYYMAGYPFGLWNSFGRRPYEFAGAWLPFSVPRALYVWVVATTLLPPVLLAAAARVLGQPRRGALAVFCLAVAVWHLDNQTSYFWVLGMSAFPFAAALAVLAVAAFVRALRDASVGWTVVAGLLLGAVGWAHQLLVFPVAAAVLVALWVCRRQVLGRGWWRPALAFALGLGLLLPWLSTLVRFEDLRAADATPFLTSGLKHLAFDLLSDRAYRGPHDQRAVFHVLLVAAACGLAIAVRRGDRGNVALGGAAFASLGFAYLFPYLPIVHASEPYRYVVAFALFAVLPAASALAAFAGHVRAANRSGRLAVAAVALVLLPAFTGITFELGKRAAVQGLDPAALQVAEWLRAEGRRDGRVLCQDLRLGDLLPHYSGQAVIGGGVSAVCPLVHSFASASPEQIAQRPVHALTVAELAERLDRYAIAHVVSVTPALDKLLRQLPGWAVSLRAGATTLWTFSGPVSFVHGAPSSRARVVAAPNAIEVRDAPAGRFTLAFHWLATLVAPPGVRLEPVLAGDDPVPFVAVDNPDGLTAIRIENR